jgi:hypothetical protein
MQKRVPRDADGIIDVTRKPRDLDNLHKLVRRYYKGRLLDVIERLTTLAEEAAATAPGGDQQHKQLPDVAERLRRSAEVALAQMNPGGVNDFCEALLAAVHITSLVPMDPALQRQVKRQLQKLRSVAGNKRKQEEAAEIGHLVRQWRAEGASVVTIQKRLLDKKKIERSKTAIYDYLKQDDSFQK